MSDELTVEDALKELRQMFPLRRIAIKIEVGPTPTNIPHYWIQVRGKYELSVGTLTLNEAMKSVRAFKQSQEQEQASK